MKTILLFFVLICSNSIISQTLSLDDGQTRALVIGISDYRHEQIPDLKYAHRDAQAFADWLQSPGGGNLPSENIQILVNNQATTGQIVASMGWLVEKSEPDDKAIIYFSGHGDVERISKFQRGYLLTHDSPPNNYLAGAFPLFGLQDIISTLSELDVQVLMVSDACRAGKLAGSAVGGTQATASALSKQFANEIKILSCQPDEFSLEGEQWGGGRGCFSYHLLEGLSGLADNNTDLQINLLEIERYLQDNVTMETAPHSQIPMAIGNKGVAISYVDEGQLAQIKDAKNHQLASISMIDAKGIEDLVLAEVDSNIQELYHDFLAAMEQGNLMNPEKQSANHYYEILSQEPSLKKLHGFMRRNFAAALQDESQAALMNLFYSTDKYYAEYFHTEKKDLSRFPSYLNRAAELLGEGHYMFNSLKARALYFKTHQIAEKKSLSHDSITTMIIDTLLTALELEPEAAFLHLHLANNYYLGDTLNAIHHYNKTLELAPDWLLGYTDYALFLRNKTQYKKSVEMCQKALVLDSTFVMAYRWMSWSYASLDELEKQAHVVKKNAEIIENIIACTSEKEIFPIYYLLLGEAYWILGSNYERGEEMLKKAWDVSKGKLPRAMTLIGVLQQARGKIKEAERSLLHAKDVHKSYIPIFCLARLYHYYLKDYKKAEYYYQKLILMIDFEKLKIRAIYYLYLSNLYYINLKDNEKAEYYCLKYINTNPNTLNLDGKSLLSQIYNEERNFEKIDTLIQSIDTSKLKSVSDLSNFANIHLQRENYELAELFFQKSIQASTKDKWGYFNLACVFALKGDIEKSLDHLEIALEKGYPFYNQLLTTSSINNIRNTEKFKQLMKKYFPEASGK